MKTFRYYVYNTQEDLDAELPTYTSSITARDKIEAENSVNEMFPGAYYLYCI